MASTNVYLPPTPCGPTSLLIANISRSKPMVITVNPSTPPYSYIVGQLVALTVPRDYGMYQANGITAEIIDIDVTGLLFSVNVDSTQFDPFVIPPMFTPMPASLSSAGARNIYNFTSVPYHSLTNTGN